MGKYDMISSIIVVLGLLIIYNILSVRFKIWIISKGVQSGLKKYYKEANKDIND